MPAAAATAREAAVSSASAPSGPDEGRSIRANVGVELKGVSLELKGAEGGD